jgi:hypothetical protein
MMHESPGSGLHYLWHPGTRDRFSGYGLIIAPWRLVGMIMVDRPTVADPSWLAEIESTFGSYQLAPMTQTGERGIVCQMEVADDSRPYIKRLVHPHNPALRNALRPLRRHPPAVTLAVRWEAAHGSWVSAMVRPFQPRFPLGQLVATPGALAALAESGHSPLEFVRRHQQGDWGEVPEEDRQENEYSVTHGFRLLSAYTLRTGIRMWIITEADRSATTILLPSEY